MWFSFTAVMVKSLIHLIKKISSIVTSILSSTCYFFKQFQSFHPHILSYLRNLQSCHKHNKIEHFHYSRFHFIRLLTMIHVLLRVHKVCYTKPTKHSSLLLDRFQFVSNQNAKGKAVETIFYPHGKWFHSSHTVLFMSFQMTNRHSWNIFHSRVKMNPKSR